MPLGRIGIIVGLVVFTSLLLAYFLAFGRQDLSALQAISFKLVFHLSLIHIASLLLQTVALWLLLNRIHPGSSLLITYMTLTASLAVGYFLPGKLGIPTRVFLYHRIFRISPAASFGLLAWELVVTTGIPLLFSIPGLWMFSSDKRVLTAVLFLILVFLSLTWTVYYLWRHGESVRGLSKIRRAISPLREGLIQTVEGINLLTLALFSFLCFLVLACSTWFSFVLLADLGSPVSFATLLPVQSLSYLTGLISLMPMGLGARELSLVVFLGEVGVPADIATYTAVIQRALASGVSFILGIVSMQLLWLKGGLRQFSHSQDFPGSA